MDIAIIGAGMVGGATGRGFARLGHNVHFYDPNNEVVERLQKEGYSASDHKLAVKVPKTYNVIFICVPEAYVDDFDAWQIGYKAGVWVIRSTVPPGTTQALIDDNKDVCICHNPEFLREAVADYEFMNPDKIVIGECCKKAGNLLEQLYKPFNVPIVRVNPTTSEFIKLTSNAYLSTQISFWNQIKLIADKMNVNSHIVGKILSLDPRISDYGASMHGKAYGGHCLPKDMAQLKTLALNQGVTAYLLDAVKEINDWIKVKT